MRRYLTGFSDRSHSMYECTLESSLVYSRITVTSKQIHRLDRVKISIVSFKYFPFPSISCNIHDPQFYTKQLICLDCRRKIHLSLRLLNLTKFQDCVCMVCKCVYTYLSNDSLVHVSGYLLNFNLLNYHFYLGSVSSQFF